MQRITPKAADAQTCGGRVVIYFQQPYVQDASFNRGRARQRQRLKENARPAQCRRLDGLVSLAKDQEREGAHILDVNVDYRGATASPTCMNWPRVW